MRIEEEMQKKEKYILRFLFAYVRCLLIVENTIIQYVYTSTKGYTRTKERERKLYTVCILSVGILTVVILVVRNDIKTMSLYAEQQRNSPNGKQS